MKKFGFGFMRLPLHDKNDMKSIDYDTLKDMVDSFMQRGFNYFDTAFMYHEGASEVAIKETVVKRYTRDSFVLADKIPTMMLSKKEDQESMFKKQLERCGVDYFDNYLLHNLGAYNYQKALQFDTFAFVENLKKEGLAKRIGFSFHDNAKLLDEILYAHPYVDFVQLQINYLDWGSDSIQSDKCYEVARKYGKPVIVMEPLKGGILANIPEKAQDVFKSVHPDMSPASWGVRFAASLDGVEMVLSGMSAPEQLDDNTSYMQDFSPLTAGEKETVKEARAVIESAVAIPCTACQYCVDTCPQNIAIPKYFSLYNDRQHYEVPIILQLYYDNYVKDHGKASDCIACGQCEEHCPQKLKIIDLLKDVAKVYEQ